MLVLSTIGASSSTLPMATVVRRRLLLLSALVDCWFLPPSLQLQGWLPLPDNRPFLIPCCCHNYRHCPPPCHSHLSLLPSRPVSYQYSSSSSSSSSLMRKEEEDEVMWGRLPLDVQQEITTLLLLLGPPHCCCLCVPLVVARSMWWLMHLSPAAHNKSLPLMVDCCLPPLPRTCPSLYFAWSLLFVYVNDLLPSVLPFFSPTALFQAATRPPSKLPPSTQW